MQGADRDLGAEAALDQTVVVAAGEHLACLDEVDGFLAGIDADDQRRFSFPVLERLDCAEGHRIVGRKHAVDLLRGIRLEHRLEHVGGRWPGIHRVLREHNFHVREFLQRVLESAQSADRGGNGVGPLQNDEVALATHRLEQRAGSVERNAVVVGTDERDDVARAQSVADIDHGNSDRVDLLHRGHHCLDVDRGEHDRVVLGTQRLIDQKCLLRDVVG